MTNFKIIMILIVIFLHCALVKAQVALYHVGIVRMIGLEYSLGRCLINAVS